MDQIKICHRLDKDTSGVLLLAKNDEAYRLASHQFESRLINKIYHAVVIGNTDFSNEMVDLPILVSSNPRVKIDVRKGKESQTILSTLRNYRYYSVVQCQPVTGRKHQIRIHLSHLGHPIAGDVMYGGPPVLLSHLKRGYHFKDEEKPLMDRMALHASSIEFRNRSGEKVYIEAPYPKDFQILMKQLEKYAS